MTDLALHLEGDDPDYEAEVVPCIDAERANRWLRKIARLKTEVGMVRDQARRERDNIAEWEARETANRRSQIDWLTNSLRAFAEQSGARTTTLPSGSLALRKLPERWDWDDETFLAWADKSYPELVRVVETKAVDKNAAKKRLTVVDGLVLADGEVVPGVTVTEQLDGFSVKAHDAEPFG
jgi:hypothetical protein